MTVHRRPREPWITIYQLTMALYDFMHPKRRAVTKAHKERMAHLRDWPKSR